MTAIVAIGGGELKDLDTLAIDREVVRLTGAISPRALFVPTASDDSDDYAQTFQAVYGGQLGCAIDVLRLIKDPPPPDRVTALIRGADLVYVGGGNTLRMMRRWRRTGVDRLLVEAYERGAVMTGLSAGALCWFRFGHSDSMSFYHPERWDYIRVRGLGLIPATGCPHHDGEQRGESFRRMIARDGGIGIALDDGCAFEMVDGAYRIVTSRPAAGAVKVFRRGGQVITEPIAQRPDFVPLGELLPSRRSTRHVRAVSPGAAS